MGTSLGWVAMPLASKVHHKRVEGSLDRVPARRSEPGRRLLDYRGD